MDNSMQIEQLEKELSLVEAQLLSLRSKAREMRLQIRSLQGAEAPFPWKDKIIKCINYIGAPMTAPEILSQFSALNGNAWRQRNAMINLSVTLNRMSKSEAIYRCKPDGAREYYHALPQWVENGQLNGVYYNLLNQKLANDLLTKKNRLSLE